MIKPLRDDVLLVPDLTRTKSNAGLVLPEDRGPAGYGIVKAVGPDVKALTVDDKVIYDKRSVKEVPYEGDDYLLVKENQIMGVMANE